jgi:UDP-GlcNAc:undecaprenyl-phosphate/decaprenyl-phosphate GlcNAc-1-phosphate transferase
MSFVLCLALTPVFRGLFKVFDIVDKPDQLRKTHQGSIPRAGGMAIAASYFGAIGLALVVLPQGSRLMSHHADVFVGLVPAIALVFLTGLVDDICGLKPKTKLAAQLLAASWACWGGVRITAINDHAVASWWAIPLTVFWLIACTNAINLIDGLDGLASGVALFATLAALSAAVVQGNIGLILATAPLAGCLVGFLRYNFNPASVFLGDSGSLTIGFLLGCFAVIWSQKAATLIGMAAPLIALSVPLIDVSLSVSRRFISNRSIFVADRGHIHHRLLARGLHPRRAALLLYGVCGAAGVVAVLLGFVGQPLGVGLMILASAFVCFGIWQLKYAEFEIARQLFVSGRFRRAVEEEIGMRRLQEGLSATRSLEDCWALICRVSRDMNFHSVTLHSAAGVFHERFNLAEENDVCHFRLTLSPGASLLLERRYQDCPDLASATFLQILRGALQAKMSAMPTTTDYVLPEQHALARAAAASLCHTDGSPALGIGRS